MRSIVIAYEDDYHEELHLLVKAMRRDRGLPEMLVEGRPVRGTGNFVHEAPRLLRTPLKQTKLPPDRVVCLADADRRRILSSLTTLLSQTSPIIAIQATSPSSFIFFTKRSRQTRLFG